MDNSRNKAIGEVNIKEENSPRNETLNKKATNKEGYEQSFTKKSQNKTAPLKFFHSTNNLRDYSKFALKENNGRYASRMSLLYTKPKETSAQDKTLINKQPIKRKPNSIKHISNCIENNLKKNCLNLNDPENFYSEMFNNALKQRNFKEEPSGNELIEELSGKLDNLFLFIQNKQKDCID